MQSFLIGVDEVGRGALAGQVYAAAVILRNKDLSTVPAYFLNKLKDSKRLSTKKRLSIYTTSLEYGLIFGVGVATAASRRCCCGGGGGFATASTAAFGPGVC